MTSRPAGPRPGECLADPAALENVGILPDAEVPAEVPKLIHLTPIVKPSQGAAPYWPVARRSGIVMPLDAAPLLHIHVLTLPFVDATSLGGSVSASAWAYPH